jgi:hypothetical protein
MANKFSVSVKVAGPSVDVFVIYWNAELLLRSSMA